MTVPRGDVMSDPVLGRLLDDLQAGSPVEATLVAMVSNMEVAGPGPGDNSNPLMDNEILAIARDPAAQEAAELLAKYGQQTQRRATALASIAQAALQSEGIASSNSLTNALVAALEADPSVSDALDRLEGTDDVDQGPQSNALNRNKQQARLKAIATIANAAKRVGTKIPKQQSRVKKG